MRQSSSLYPNILLWLLVVTTIAVASYTRLDELGALGLSGDEDITAHASLSLSQKGVPEMPSEMSYWRGLPLSWLNAQLLPIVGEDNELSYRLAPAILGLLSLALIYFLARDTLTWRVALICMVMLALSEWHINMSRTARMYGPLLLFEIGYSYYAWKFVSRGSAGSFLASIFFALVAGTLHFIAILFAAFPLAMLLQVSNRGALARSLLMTFSVAVPIVLYHRMVVQPGFEKFIEQFEIVRAVADRPDRLLGKIERMFPADGGLQIVVGALIIIVAICATWIYLSSNREGDKQRDLFRLAVDSVCISGLIVFSSFGQIFGVGCLAAIFLVATRQTVQEFYRSQKWLVIFVIFLLAINIVYELVVGSGIRQLFAFPYPIIIGLAKSQPLITFLFSLAVLRIVFAKQGVPPFIRVAVTIVLGLVFGIGLIEKWPALRYLSPLYPFMILVAGWSIVTVFERFVPVIYGNKAWMMILLIAGLLALPIGEVGVAASFRAANHDYQNALNSSRHEEYPDHKSPGLFVNSILRPTDIIIAEDPLIQQWYVGRVDFCLTDLAQQGRYFVRDPDTGAAINIYNRSIMLSNEELTELLSYEKGSVYFITSAETAGAPDHYLNEWQISWMEDHLTEQNLKFIGRDNLTKVYCVNCK